MPSLTAEIDQGKQPALVLGIDTCGPSGSVALCRLEADTVQVLGQKALEGRSYSATLVMAVRDLLSESSVELSDVAFMVVLRGPGSFTGVRVGLSAAKGLAEPGRIPVVALSRLEVLAHKTEISSAALDAHRNEIYLRLEDGTELLAGSAELSAQEVPVRIAVCDEGAVALLRRGWPGAELIVAEPPTAADAVRMSVPRIRGREFADLELLDGHYLRRSDAEIFGAAAQAGQS